MDGIGPAARTIRHVLFRLLVGLASAFAAGCLTVVVVMLPFFTAEKVFGLAPPANSVGLIILGTGAIAAVLAFANSFREFSVPPPGPRRTLRQRLNNLPGFYRPPWIVPHPVSTSSVVGQALAKRLGPVGTGTNVYRDRETGQLWHEVYWEQSLGSGTELVPAEQIDTFFIAGMEGSEKPPWEKPRDVWAHPTARIADRLFERLDTVEPDPVYPEDKRSGLFRDRETGQLWRSVVYFGEQGDNGHVLSPVLPTGNTPSADQAKSRKPRS